MKKSVAVLLWVLVLAVVAFAAGHIDVIDPSTNQSNASSISDADVSALAADDSSVTYVDASTLQSIIASTSDATTQQKAASTAAAALNDNTRVVSFATVDTSSLSDGVVIPIKVSASNVNSGQGLYAYIGGTLYEGGDNMYLKTVNGSTFICVKWKDVLNGKVMNGSGVEDSATADLLTPVAISSTGGTLGGSSGGCSTGMSALAFGVLGLFLACRKK